MVAAKFKISFMKFSHPISYILHSIFGYITANKLALYALITVTAVDFSKAIRLCYD